jgi:hypothetical protein
VLRLVIDFSVPTQKNGDVRRFRAGGNARNALRLAAL